MRQNPSCLRNTLVTTWKNTAASHRALLPKEGVRLVDVGSLSPGLLVRLVTPFPANQETVDEFSSASLAKINFASTTHRLHTGQFN